MAGTRMTSGLMPMASSSTLALARIARFATLGSPSWRIGDNREHGVPTQLDQANRGTA